MPLRWENRELDLRPLSQSESSARLVNTLLTELDGLESRKQVFVIGATNRPDILDPAMCRPGRLDKLLYVDLPSPAERVEVLRAVTRQTPLAADVDLARIATSDRAEGLSGADLSALAREAAVSALRELFSSIDLDGPAPEAIESSSSSSSAAATGAPPIRPPQVSMRHFEAALERANPSVSRQQRRRFEALRRKFAGSPLGHKGEAVEQEPAGEEGGAEARQGGAGVGGLAAEGAQ